MVCCFTARFGRSVILDRTASARRCAAGSNSRRCAISPADVSGERLCGGSRRRTETFGRKSKLATNARSTIVLTTDTIQPSAPRMTERRLVGSKKTGGRVTSSTWNHSDLRTRLQLQTQRHRSELVQLHGPHERLSNVPFTAHSPHRAATQLGRTVLRGVDLHETQCDFRCGSDADDPSMSAARLLHP